MNVVAAFGIGLYNEYKLIRCSNFHKGVIMEYQVLIFMTEKYLSAAEIISENEYEIISIDGNEAMEYCSDKDIQKFCSCIKEYYNIDEFSDLEIEISLVYGTVGKAALALIVKQINGVDKLDIMKATKLFPIVLMQNKMVHKNKRVQFGFLEETYQVQCNEDMQLRTEKVTGEKVLNKIGYGDFTCLYYPKAGNLENDAACMAKIKSLEEKLDEKDCIIEKLDTEKKEVVRQLNQSSKRVMDLERLSVEDGEIIIQLKQEKDSIMEELELFLEKARTICKASFNNSSFWGDVLLKQQIKDGENVKSGDIIFSLEPLDKLFYCNKHEKFYRAPRDGKVFWLVDDNLKISMKSSLFSGSIDVFIITNKLDNKENVLKWYESKPEFYNGTVSLQL